MASVKDFGLQAFVVYIVSAFLPSLSKMRQDYRYYYYYYYFKLYVYSRIYYIFFNPLRFGYETHYVFIFESR